MTFLFLVEFLKNLLNGENLKVEMIFYALQVLGAQYIREWRQCQPSESKSGRKNEKTIFSESLHSLSRPFELLSKSVLIAVTE